MKHQRVINCIPASQIKPDQRRQQNQPGQAHLDQLAEYRHPGLLRRGHHSKRLRRGLHAGISFCCLPGSEMDWGSSANLGSGANDLTATRIVIAPVINLNAPTATCAVAMSADLLAQIVAAPSAA